MADEDDPLSRLRKKAGLDKTYQATTVPEGATGRGLYDTRVRPSGLGQNAANLLAQLETLGAAELRLLLHAIETELAKQSVSPQLVAQLPTMQKPELQALKSAVQAQITETGTPSTLVTSLPVLSIEAFQNLLAGVQTRLNLVVDQTPKDMGGNPDLSQPPPLSIVTTWFGQTFQVPFYINGHAGYFYLSPATIGSAGAQEVVVTNLDTFDQITVDLYGSDYLGSPAAHIAKVDASGNLYVVIGSIAQLPAALTGAGSLKVAIAESIGQLPVALTGAGSLKVAVVENLVQLPAALTGAGSLKVAIAETVAQLPSSLTASGNLKTAVLENGGTASVSTPTASVVPTTFGAVVTLLSNTSTNQVWYASAFDLTIAETANDTLQLALAVVVVATGATVGYFWTYTESAVAGFSEAFLFSVLAPPTPKTQVFAFDIFTFQLSTTIRLLPGEKLVLYGKTGVANNVTVTPHLDYWTGVL
jgi:peptidoglycan hydrolase-like protein with peptidoglycan-binding domain